MSGFVESFRNIFKIQELRQRIIFTVLLLIVVRIGAHITLPGIDTGLLAEASKNQSDNTLFGLYDLFVGGAFKNAAVFALGIMPYISSSIIIQLLGAVIPYFQKLQKEGEAGRKKINQMTRYGTVPVALMQAWGVSVQLGSRNVAGVSILSPEISPFLFTVSCVILLTAGTIFMMWLGEQITERGIGNGISLIIFIGIIDRFPYAVFNEIDVVKSGARNLIIELLIIVGLVLIIAAVVLVTQAMRRIPVQYAKRVVGRKIYGGVTQYIPLRVNQAGVMPIIFAQSIMFVPNTILTFFPNSDIMQSVAQHFNQTSLVYALLYGSLIVFFTYFYTAIAFNPKDVSDNMKKQGGFVPGVRPGKATSDFIDNILTKITLPGSIFLAFIAILPAFIAQAGVTQGLSQFFGGTSLLIIVGVALDTLQQVESHLVMRHYDGFMKSGRIRGRRA
ncbi:MAG: preprotein translocase subunit SecY [Ignavibacteriae bacterium]|nr:MAG: preprotein translocase subunit SecY [Ignavibacteriota bacterium]